MDMLNVQLVQKVKVITGAGCVKQLAQLILEAGCRKPLIVYDMGTLNAGIVDNAIASLKENKINFVVFDKVVPDPPVHVVEEGIKICRKEECDMVIGIGGGSSIDTAKAINIMRYNEGSILRFRNPEEVMKNAPGFVAIPTTAGTGSELSDGIILTDAAANTKFAVLASAGIAEYAIIDPMLMLTMPAILTAATGIDALAHTLESYTSILANDFSDQIVEKNAETIIKYLPIAVREGSNIEARKNMAVAATMGGWMLACVHTHSGHSIAHVIGAKCHIPHGLACAYCLPYVMEFVTPVMPEKIRKIIEIFGENSSGIGENELGVKVRGLLQDFNNSVGIEINKELIKGVSLEELAVEIETEMFQTFAPRYMGKQDALEILRKIFS